jgi:hypothetical protein
MPRVLSDQGLRNWCRIESLVKETERLCGEPERHQPPPITPPPQRQKRLTSLEVVQVLQLYQGGAEMRKLADQFGVHKHTISQCLKRMGAPLRKQGLRDDDIEDTAQL